MNRLTPEQMQQQEAAAYGLPQRPQSIDVSNMTHEQIEALRGVLFQHDARNAAMQREFDLNKPPTPPYRYQEFPRMLYLGRQTAIVKDAFELEQYLEQGWSKEPLEAPMLNLGGDLPPAMMAEVQRIDAEARRSAQSELEKQIEVLKAENETLRIGPKRK